MPEAKAFERLPKIITPVNYNIRLKPTTCMFILDYVIYRIVAVILETF
jgi:hypothetical protein